MSRRRNKKYSAELKLQAVQDYLTGRGSYETLKEKYKLRSSTQLRDKEVEMLLLKKLQELERGGR